MPRRTSKVELLELRNWLKRTLRFGVLDRVPARFGPDSHGDGPPTRAYATKLQAELRNPDGGTRSLEDVIADIRAFRDWVEARQQTSRRVIMAALPDPLPNWAVQVYRAPRFGVTNASSQLQTTWTTPDPNQHPLWDKWLDF